MNDPNTVPHLVWTFEHVPYVLSSEWTARDAEVFQHFAEVLETPVSDPHFRIILNEYGWHITSLHLPDIERHQPVTEIILNVDGDGILYSHVTRMTTADAIEFWRHIVAFIGADASRPHVMAEMRADGAKLTTIAMDAEWNW